MKTARLAACAGAALFGMACADFGMPSADVAGALTAFESVPAGFSSTSSTFAMEGDLDGPFQPHRGDGSFEDRGLRGDKRGPGGDERRGPGRDRFGFMMGGGLGPEFFGFGFGKGRGRFNTDRIGEQCVFAASTGLLTCGPVTKRGLTIFTTAAIKTADGVAQPGLNSLTHSVVLHSEVSGTVTRRDSATSRINHVSDRTVTGLSEGSTRLTVDGTAVGTETTNGTTDAGVFSAIRTVNDTTAGIVIPIATERPTYPMAGRISRNMSVAVTVEGTTTTHTRSEVVTYDGSATATIVITQDGVSKTCTMKLPIGRLVCE